MLLAATVAQAQITIGGNVYGGGNAGDMTGSTKVVVRAGKIEGGVYGGARQANVGKSAFVHIDGQGMSDDIIIKAVYGGNDISGTVGTDGALENVPTELTQAAANGITDATGSNKDKNKNNYNAFVLTTPERTAGTGETQRHIFIAQLFGGGNGDYTYQDDNITKPELSRTYLELRGGTFGYVYGGGNNATVTDKTDICIFNTGSIWDINGADGEENTNSADDVLSDHDLINMGINTTFFNQNAKYHFSRVFGGNNKAPMAIKPTWHLQRGRIENLYSGGNEGAMTNPQGLLLEIAPTGTDEEKKQLVIENVYGGCRKADVHPNVTNDEEIKLTERDAQGNLKYKFPAGLAARVLVRGGDINNVYGGNDVKGHVYGGNAVGVYTSIRGDIYGGGNGSYAYTDNPALKNDLRWGDFYYEIPTGKSSVEALNDTRPNAEQVSIRVMGTDTKPTIIGGSIYVGGNSATLKMKEGATITEDYPRVELKVGSYVIADQVFLGNNGADMITEDILSKYAPDAVKIANNVVVKDQDGHSISNFSGINLTDAANMEKYMASVAMDLKPKLVFDKLSNQDPADYLPYSSQFGSLYLGGNVGSMTYDGVNNAKIDAKIIVFDKMVGGSNNANVLGSAYNAPFEGGVIGNPDPTTGNKIVLNIEGPKIRPMRWVVERAANDYNTKILDSNGKEKYVLNNGQRQLEWNLVNNSQYNSATKKFQEVNPTEVPTTIRTASEDDLARRFAGGNVYGGCCESGRVNGNVVINIDTTLIERDILFDTVESDQFGEEVSLYGNDQITQATFNITAPKTGVILAQQGMDVLGAALNVFGGGKGKRTEIWGSTTINLNKGYAFQVFGGSEEGIIGKYLVNNNNTAITTTASDGTYTNGIYAFNGKSYQYNPAYSCYINLRGDYAGVTKTNSENSPSMAECEFMYGGAFLGPIVGNTVINMGKGRIFNSFAGSCNADILGHTETYIGRQIKKANKDLMGKLGSTEGIDNEDNYEQGFPWVRDITYGGNDLGGRILGSKSFKNRVRTDDNGGFDVLGKVHKYSSTNNPNPAVLTANAYTEYLQGRADAIFGGCYGTYNYADSKYSEYFDENGDAKPGFFKPQMDNAFVNFRPTYTQVNNKVNKVYGAGQGYSGDKFRDKMQKSSYVLIDIPQSASDPSYMSYYKTMEVFGAGAWGGVGMSTFVEPVANPNAAQEATLDANSAIVDLVRGQLGAVYGGSFTEGVTRRTVINVPSGSTVEIQNIFGGAYGYNYLQPCDVYEANVNYDSDLATVTGAIFGGNNSERRTLFGKVNVNATVWSDKDRSKNYYGTVFGAGLGGNTWSEYTEVNLNDGATVYEVYGGGKAGKVYNAESIEHYMNFFATAIPASAWTLGTGYYVPTMENNKYSGYTTSALTNLSNPLTRMADIDDRDYIATTDVNYKKYNTNVIINKGATVSNYAYGGGLGELAKVSGTTYIALLGGTVKKDIYAAGTSGAVQDTLATHKFIASSNAYVEGGTCRNVYGGGWNGSVGKHPDGANPIFDKDGKAINAVDVIAGGFTNDVYGETHVVIGKLQEDLGAAPAGDLDYYFYHGIPTIQRNAYGGGEGGPVFGCTHLTLNNGYIGYDFNAGGTDNPETTDIDERYEEKIVDETNKDKDGHFIENKNLMDSGCLFGGGYIDNSSVDSTNVKMFGGHVRNALFGGGEIAAIGRGKISASGENNSVRSLDVIYKAGKTNIEMFGGHVHRNVFGGGRGYNNLGKQGTLFSDGFVFGQTEVHIHGGEIGTALELAVGNGNVFGGGDIGYVYSAYEYDANGTKKLGRGIKKGVRYDDGQEGYYYRNTGNNGTFTSDANFEMAGTEYIPTEDCKVLIEPWTKVTGNGSVSFEGIHYAKGHVVSSVDLEWLKENSPTGINLTTDLDITTGKVTATDGITFTRSYDKGEYVPTYALNTLGNKNSDTKWNSLDPTGIIIHNGVFAGGNTSSGSSTIYANATSVYGNATASIHDVYHRDLITMGTGHTGGLYGDGNLTFVDGYRGLNITNYGTDYYSISEEVTIDQYHALPEREAAYYELKYKCEKACVDKDGTHYLPASQDGKTKASTITADDLLSLFLVYNETTKKYVSVKDGDTDILIQDAIGNWHPNTNYWKENGVLPVYAGRLMNSIQRADFCGVFGSRMVMQGAQDRVPEIVDFTNYTINRVREVSLNQQHSVIAADQSIEKNKIHGNYFGIYNIVNYLGALSSDVHFMPNEDVRQTSNVSNDAFKKPITIDGHTYNYGEAGATYYNWKRAKIKDNTRNNGSSYNKVALASGVYLELTTEKSTGVDLYEKDWGYITGVIELDLINVQTGIGGGFVYAKNEHRIATFENKKHVTLTALNADAITRKNFTYTDNSEVEWETSGNFVHSTQTIIDDCYNISGKYQGTDAVPAHYWFIKGQVYVYDQYISAYTGAPNAYSETVNIPLTITAASHGTMKLLNVMPNKYAYYSAPGVELQNDNKVVVNDVAYYKNDPISYWDYYLLSRYEKDLFVNETYVVIDSCKLGNKTYPSGYVMLPDEYNTLANAANSNKHVVETGGSAVPAVQMMTKNEQNQDVPVTDSNGQPVYKAFDYVFRESNNLGHETGYILTYKVNNPTEWSTWYTQKNGNVKNQEGGSAFEDGPTYHLISGTGSVLGQRDYEVGDLISEEVYYTYVGKENDSNYPGITSHINPEVDGVQAVFGPAYLVTQQFSVTDDKGATHHYNPGSAVDATLAAAHSSSTAPAYICTSTVQLSKTEFILMNTKMTENEKSHYIDGIKDQIKELGTFADAANPTAAEISALTPEKKSEVTSLLAVMKDIEDNIVPAYYCTTAGRYGGNYYESGKNYRGLEAFSSMTKDDRDKFVFNYDALDLLIDPAYGGVEGRKYQYDGEDTSGVGFTTELQAATNPAGYSLVKPVDYTAEYRGTTALNNLPDGGIKVKRNGTEQTVTSILEGDELSRKVYEESLTNEQRHYVPIKVQASNLVEESGKDPVYKVYVVSTPFQVGNSPYAVGSVLTASEYGSLGDDKVNVTQLIFPKDATDSYLNKTYYYCREDYTISENGKSVAVASVSGVTAKNSGNTDITVTRDINSTDPVQAGLVINETYYDQLAAANQQKNFIIHGIAPTETSTLYVSRESDIFDLSKEKIITVIYQYDYEEVDENGKATPISERHVVNIHITFKSGVPSVEDIKTPQIIIPGDYVNLREPAVTPGAYEVSGGGWELFETIGDAESHSNGIEYSPQFDPLYWYQDDWYVAYYAKTYLGKTYSNHVQVSVANYHDLKKVMEAMEHHYYVDNSNVKRSPKIYINDYSADAAGSKNGLDLLKNLFDLSVLNSPQTDVNTGLINDGGTFNGHKPLNNIVRGGDNLEFYLRTDIEHPSTWTSIGSGTDCFAGTLHGDGHHLSKLSSSLFDKLCGQVYNLGVSGSFTGAGVAETGKGYVENCWVKTTGEIPANTTVKAVFGDPTDTKGTQVENCYYAESNAYSEATHARGNAKKMPDKAFYNGEVAYNLNGFYLHKRYYDGINQNSGTQYSYLAANADGTLPDNMSQGYYPSDYAIYPLDTSKPQERGYVENRFFDGDFQYANGNIPEDPEVRMRTVKVTEGTGANAKEVDKTYYLPIWPDDYLFFGQSLNYGHVAGRTHQDVPSAINRSGDRLLTTEAGNRVYRAPAYFQNSNMSVAHFNPFAVFAQTKKGDNTVKAYEGLTAIDFTGYNDVTNLSGSANPYKEGWQKWSKYSYKTGDSDKDYAFFPPLLDDGGLSGFINVDVTRNLLVYTGVPGGTGTNETPTFAQKTANVVSGYLSDKIYDDHVINSTYPTVRAWDSPADEVRGHWVQKSGNGFTAKRDHLLVDKQDFNAPMGYQFADGQRMWHQRMPADNTFVDRTTGWQGISLPFTAELVTTDTKGEITHFYSGSEDSKNGTGSKIGHEYWLREYRDIENVTNAAEKAKARFTYPDASDTWEQTMNKTVENTFLWDYYYEGNHGHLDSNKDTYQTYYGSSRTYNNYVMLGNGTPYLIGFPGATYYEFDLSGNWTAENTASTPPEKIGAQTITFASPTGYKVSVSDEEQRLVTFNGYTFRPSYLNKKFAAGTANTYTLKADGSSFDLIPTASATEVYAFRPYFTVAASGARPVTRSIIFGNDDSEMKGVIERGDPTQEEVSGTLNIYAKKHKIIVESALGYSTDVRIVNLAGITINAFTIEPGETVETRINTSGVYIVEPSEARFVKKLSVR